MSPVGSDCARIVLFDIDGTLVHTGGAGVRSVDLAFRRLHGVPAPFASARMAGRTDLAILRDVFREHLGRECTQAELEEVAVAYLEFLAEELERTDYRLLPGVEELLTRLAQEPRVLLGLATGNLEQGAFLKLRRGGIDHFFTFGGYGSDSEDRVRLTQMAINRGRARAGAAASVQAVVIGDTRYDIECGRAAGGRTLAVATGPASVSDLAAHQPDLVVSDLGDQRVPAWILDGDR
jgi:phosphoglycolate phosphatase